MNAKHICNSLWDLRNSSDSGGGNKLPLIKDGLRFAGFAIYFTTCVLGLIGNSLVILVISCKMKNRKAMTWFLNLAVADLLFLCCLPFRAISMFLGQWDFGWFLCKVYHFLSNVNMYVSIFILTALSIDRCLSVVLPIWHRTCGFKQYIRWVCLMLWFITTAMSLPGFLYSELVTVDNKAHCSLGLYKSNPIHFDHLFLNSSDCLDKNKSAIVPFTYLETFMEKLWKIIGHLFIPGKFGDLPQHREGCQNESVQEFFNHCVNKVELEKWNAIVRFSELLFIPMLTFGFLIPLVVIAVANIIIVVQAKHSKKQASSKLYRVVVAIVVTYFIAWTPLASTETLFLIAARRLDLSLMYSLDTVLPLVSSISCLHSCLNPVLYVLLGKKVKASLSESWSDIWKRLVSGSDNSSKGQSSKAVT